MTRARGYTEKHIPPVPNLRAEAFGKWKKCGQVPIEKVEKNIGVENSIIVVFNYRDP